MTRYVGVFLPVLLLACNGDKPAETDTTDTTTDTEDTTSTGGELTEDAVGDFSCFTPADDAASAAWLTQQVDPDKVETFSLDGFVQDFQTDDPRNNTEVRLWYGDIAEGTPTETASTDDDGDITITAESCDPLAYLALRNPALDDAKATYKAHQVYPPNATTAEFTTVSTDTYLLIPTLLGISPDPAKSIIAGTAFDCTRDPSTLSSVDAGKVRNIQVVLKDSSGNIPEGVFIRYYREEFPDRDAIASSEDGLWTAIDVPVGDYTVEMWGLVGGERKLLGTTSIRSVADSINIANIFAGYEGVKFPESCLATPGGGDTDDTDADTDI